MPLRLEPCPTAINSASGNGRGLEGTTTGAQTVTVASSGRPRLPSWGGSRTVCDVGVVVISGVRCAHLPAARSNDDHQRLRGLPALTGSGAEHWWLQWPSKAVPRTASALRRGEAQAAPRPSRSQPDLLIRGLRLSCSRVLTHSLVQARVNKAVSPIDVMTIAATVGPQTSDPPGQCDSAGVNRASATDCNPIASDPCRRGRGWG